MKKICSLSESEFLAQVIKYAHLCGWRTAHFRPGRTASGWRTCVQGDAAGFPDLVLVRDRLIFAELKTNRGKLTPQQENWIKALYPFAEAVVWRPADWPAIVRSLR